MTLSMLLLLLLLGVALALFALEWLSVDVVTLLLLVTLVMAGILTPQEAFSGFANEIVIILASIFIISGVFVETGVMEWLGRAIHRIGGRSESKAVAYVMLLSAGISAMISNTSSTAILMPATFELGKRGRISPSRLLIPLAFASMLGGTCTVIGTSTNLAASGMMRKLGLAPISMFELAPVGGVLVLAGVAYMTWAGRHLLPGTVHPSLSEEYRIREYLSEVVIPDGSELDGRSIESAGFAGDGVAILAVDRGEERIYPFGHTVLQKGDSLIVQATRQALLELDERPGLAIRADVPLDDQDFTTETIAMVEAIVMPRSSLIGRTLRQLDLRKRFGFSVLAIYSHGQTYPTGVADLSLGAGDVLLLQGPRERIDALREQQELWTLGEVAHIPFRRRRGTIAMVALGSAIVLGASNVVPLSIALLAAALATVIFRCVDAGKIYRFIDWRVIVLIGGMTSFGLAMQKTGTADYLAGLIAVWMMPLGIYFVLGAFALLTMILTQPMSNAAAALVVLPIAMSTAAQLDANPRTFAILVTLSASLSFIAPFEPACLLVYGPGKYKFSDFLKTGLGFTAVVFVVVLWLVPRIWPL